MWLIRTPDPKTRLRESALHQVPTLIGCLIFKERVPQILYCALRSSLQRRAYRFSFQLLATAFAAASLLV